MKRFNDYTILFFALGTAFVLVYFVPQVLNKMLFFIFIYLFYKSDKDYLWLAFIFILMENPGELFGGALRDEEMRLPIYSIVPSMSITFQQIFIVTALIKAVKRKIVYSPLPIIKNNLNKLFLYFIFLLLLSLALGINIEIIRYLYSVIIDLTLYYSVYCLFTRESDYINFFKLLIPFGFIALGIQLYGVGAGQPLAKLFNPYINIYSGTYDIDSGDVRPIVMTHLVVFVFFFSLYFLLKKKDYFNKNLLFAVNIATFFSIVLAATRSWVLMTLMFYLLSFMLISVKTSKVFMRYSVIGVVSVILLFSSGIFVEQLDRALDRISTLEYVAQGDITGGGTIKRYDIRAPLVMKAFYEESTIIFGAGFSELYFRNSDPHVGFHNLLLNTGIVGIILFALFFASVIVNTFSIDRKLSNKNPYKDVLKIFPIALISLMFVNSGTQFYGYHVGFGRTFLIVFILYFLNNQMSCAMQWEEENSC